MALINVAINFGYEYFCFVIYFSRIFLSKLVSKIFFSKFFFFKFFCSVLRDGVRCPVYRVDAVFYLILFIIYVFTIIYVLLFIYYLFMYFI